MQAVVKEPVVRQQAVGDLAARRDTAGVSGTASRTASLLWRVWLPIPILLLLLDTTFGFYFWKILKVSRRAADYGYQFQLDVQRLRQPKAAGAVRVVAVGSSVTGSFDAYQVEGLLAASTPGVQVHRLLLPGIKPSDTRIFLAAEGEALAADAIVLVVNLVDFLNPSFERDLKEQVRYVLPPWHTLRDRGAHMPFSGKLDLVLAGVSDLYRYRKLVRSALRDHVKLAIRWGRTRAPHGAYGIYPDAYAAQQFGLPVNGNGAMDLEYYVAPEWIQQRGRVGLRFSVAGKLLAQGVENTPGWKTIRLPVSASDHAILDVHADGIWVPRASDAGEDVRPLSVRLRQVPANVAGGGTRPWRYPPVDEREVDAFLRFGDPGDPRFAARWNEVLQSDSPFAKRFRRYRQVKVAVRDQPFHPAGEYAELERLVRDLSARGVAVVIVNSPESPWILNEYGPSPYYRAYLAFLAELAAQYRDVTFHDLSDVLPAVDFNDWHHVNYVGAAKLGPRYAQFIDEALTARRRRM